MKSLGEEDEVGALGGSLGARRDELLGVAAEVADQRIELREGDPDARC